MKSGLTHYPEFKKLLTSYNVSSDVREVLQTLKILLVVAPTSTGGSTVIRRLVEEGDYYFVISDTTRQPQLRDGRMEQNGIDYYFKTEEEMMANLTAGEYLAPAIIHEQQVSGIGLSELEKAKKLQKIAVTNIEVVGAAEIMRTAPEATAIFLVPPNFEIWQNRLNNRGHMSSAEIKNRLKSAVEEFKAALEHQYYHLVIADNVEHATQTIDDLVKGKPNYQQGRALELIHHLQFSLQQKLESIDKI